MSSESPKEDIDMITVGVSESSPAPVTSSPAPETSSPAPETSSPTPESSPAPESFPAPESSPAPNKSISFGQDVQDNDEKDVPKRDLGERGLSYYSKKYDIDGDGRLDALEQAMRDMDMENDGHLKNDQVYAIMQDQKDTMKKYLSMRRILIAAAVLIVILAVSSFVTAFAAVMIAKDMEENNGKLASKETGKTMGTQSAATNYRINGPEITADGRRMESTDNSDNPFRDANAARELFDSCIEGEASHIQVGCEINSANFRTYHMCGEGAKGTPTDAVDNVFEYVAGYGEGEHRITVDCTGQEGNGPCAFTIPGCPAFDRDGAIPGNVIIICDREEDMQSVASQAQAENANAQAQAVGRSINYAKLISVSQSERENMQQRFPNCVLVDDTAVYVESADWGKYRIDDRIKDTTDTTYEPSKTGTGVKVYVMDTGIQADHSEFGGRVLDGPNFVDNDGLDGDQNGHGTHVAGIIGGTTHGVAPNVNLVPVKVLDSNGVGHVSDVIEGLDYIHAEVSNSETAGAVVTMAFAGNGQNCELNNLVNTVARLPGLVVVAAAGNVAGGNGCDASPASASKALTVGAINEADQLADFSSIGECVDMYAPGTDISSAKLDGGSTSKSGTSMAAAHAAGAAALMIESLDFSLHPDVDIKKLMVDHASADQIAGNIEKNKLLYVGDYCESNDDCTSTGARNVCGCGAVCSTDASCPEKTAVLLLAEEGGTCDSEYVVAVNCCQTIPFFHSYNNGPKCDCRAVGCTDTCGNSMCSAANIDSSAYSGSCVF